MSKEILVQSAHVPSDNGNSACQSESLQCRWEFLPHCWFQRICDFSDISAWGSHDGSIGNWNREFGADSVSVGDDRDFGLLMPDARFVFLGVAERTGAGDSSGG